MNEIIKITNSLILNLHYEYYDKVIELVRNNGLWLEFGVCTGHTINYISSKTKNKIYGFDSFWGLPENWGSHHPKGTYSTNGQIPIVNSNVELIVGLFQDVLDEFLITHLEPVAYLHMDADIYSSTKYVLNKLKDRIHKGTVISFDEIHNYNEFEEHELKAWIEFSKENNIIGNWIYRTNFEQATCIIN